MDKDDGTLLDDIVKTLQVEGESAKFADLSADTAAEFFSGSDPAAKHTDSRNGKAAIVLSEAKNQPVSGSARAPVETQMPDLTSMDLQTLRQVAVKCTRCPLHKDREHVVFGCGQVPAELMFIGEAPGAEEDSKGVPFVGAAGQLLTQMIKSMQFQRSDVYISNIVKCRPPGNRIPEDSEAQTCMPFLRRQIELVSPKVIVLLGAVPLKYILNKTGITSLRGRWESYGGIRVMPTFHPAYLLRNENAKKFVWEDLQQVMKCFGKVHKPVRERTS
ncbi:MAG: uracil-DNA glycosylase [Victivallales bacterium]|nr:uracil-DNA glycosylase [Victivallales bacterium]